MCHYIVLSFVSILLQRHIHIPNLVLVKNTLYLHLLVFTSIEFYTQYKYILQCREMKISFKMHYLLVH